MGDARCVEEGRRKLRNTFSFANQEERREFLRRFELIAQKEGQHPELMSHDKSVTITTWTPQINGLHPNDFIMAAKADGVYTLVLVGAEGDMSTEEPLPRLGDLPRFRRLLARRAKGTLRIPEGT